MEPKRPKFQISRNPSIEDLAMRYHLSDSPMTGMLIINQMDKRFGEKVRNKAITEARQTLIIVGLRQPKGHHANKPIRRKAPRARP